jgi:acetylornithine/N-succinyldiaminopimelate aminotransferase
VTPSHFDPTPELLEQAQDVLIQNYGRLPVVFVRGHFSMLWDAAGNEYIDLFAGFGGGILGHAHPELVSTAKAQLEQLWHVGNSFHTIPQIEFATKLKQHAFDGRAFFCHSGLEANEAAVKLARLRGLSNGGKRWKTVSLIKSFHGRSLAMIAATGNPAVKEGFGPAVPGFTNVDPLDFDALHKAIDDETCCIIMEPVQGEGGVNMYPPGHARKIRDLCDQHGLSLIFDEVWTGCGRTGKWFGHQWFTPETHELAAHPTLSNAPVLPDIMTLGKAVGGGLPVGVMFAQTELSKLLVAGKHGCTLGGNPTCMAVSNKIFQIIERDDLVRKARKLGDHAKARLSSDDRIKSKIKEVRGHGLFLGIELAAAPEKFIEKCLDQRVISNLTAKNVVRVAPAINITQAEWDMGLDRLCNVIASL